MPTYIWFLTIPGDHNHMTVFSTASTLTGARIQLVNKFNEMLRNLKKDPYSEVPNGMYYYQGACTKGFFVYKRKEFPDLKELARIEKEVEELRKRIEETERWIFQHQPAVIENVVCGICTSLDG